MMFKVDRRVALDPRLSDRPQKHLDSGLLGRVLQRGHSSALHV